MHLHLAEAPGESDLAGGWQALIAKQQELVLQERGIERREIGIADRRDLEVEDLGAEPARERFEAQCRG